jgi:protein SCO1/2
VRLVSISSDPEKDTPAVLRGYAETFKAGARWYFLTGKKDTIYELANQGFLLSLTEDPANKTEPITHATRLVLVDKAGAIRGYYDGMTSEGVAKLVADLRRLREERRDERDTKDTAAR